MNLLATGGLMFALAAAQGTTEDRSEDAQRGSAPTPRDANRAADQSQRGSRGATAGGSERTGPPAPGLESGDANGMAGGRTDEGPRGGTGIREGGEHIRRDRARRRANDQARGPNKKGSFERPAESPAQMNRDPQPKGSGAPMTPAERQPKPQGRNHVEGPQHGAAGGVASDPNEAAGGSSPSPITGKGAENQPDRKETGSESEPKR
jgi:hypothetical protein